MTDKELNIEKNLECGCAGDCGDNCKCKESEKQVENSKELNNCRICKNELFNEVKETEFENGFLYKECSKCHTVNVLTKEQTKN